jgi:hypothetical protein
MPSARSARPNPRGARRPVTGHARPPRGKIPPAVKRRLVTLAAAASLRM